MADDTDEDSKTEDPSPERIRKAREEGNVPRSKELTTFAVTMTGVVLLIFMGSRIGTSIQLTLQNTFAFSKRDLAFPFLGLERFWSSVANSLWALAPFLVMLFIMALAVPMLIGGGNFTTKTFTPKFSKLNPVSGVKRIFGIQALTEGLKAILKSFLIGGIATWFIWKERATLVALVSVSLHGAISLMFELMAKIILIVTASMLLIVLIDVPFQLFQYNKKLRMSKNDLKQEYKQQEGSPEVKNRIRILQREAARRRMMAEVPRADVIVTNPTHYAAALQYEEGMVAPKLLAKGSQRVAEKIIEIAREHHIDVVQAPPFARALYFNTELNEFIPHELYQAAAQVLAYIYQLEQYQKFGGTEPELPEDFAVPPEMDGQHLRRQLHPQNVE